MRRINTLTRLALSVLFISSCTKTRLEDYALLWSLEMPRISSPYVYWYGAKVMSKWGNTIVTHTTLYDETGLSDNRLCGVDLDERKVVWLYPENQNERKNIVFDNKGYQHNDIFVVKYVETLPDESHLTHVAGIEIMSGKERWCFSEPTKDNAAFYPDISGLGRDCYFINDGQRVYKADALDGTVKLIHQEKSLRIANAPLFLSDGRIGLVRYDYDGEVSNDEILVLNPDSYAIEKVISLPISFKGRCTRVINDGNVLYCSIAHNTYSFDLDNCSIVWESSNPGYDGGLELNDGILLETGVSSTIAFNAQTGEPVYGFPELGADLVSVYGKRIYYLASYGELLIMNLHNGQVLKRIKCPDKGEYFFGSYPTVYGNNLYIMGITKLYCYKLG